MEHSLIVIPTYNEFDNITLMIQRVFSISDEPHILVVDDSSPDGTSNAVRKLQEEYQDKLFLLERKEKKRPRNGIY